MKKRPTVGYLTTDWAWGTEPLQPNGCAWYRCALPAIELEKRGWVTGMGLPGFSREKGFGILTSDNAAINGWDIIFFKLIMSIDALEAMDRAKELGQKVVVDVDDWFEGLHPSNRAYKVTDPKTNPNNNRQIYSEIIMKADAVITSTNFLFDFYSQKRNNVFLIKNGIDLNRWKRRVPRMAGHRLNIGWVGATPWRSDDLQQLKPFFGKYMDTRRVGFHHSGHTGGDAPTAASQLGVNVKSVKTAPLVPILDYPKLFRPIDIGIVPLSNVPFNHAKSYIKGLEYAASGIPFVASYSPEYEELSNLGIGRVARSNEEWVYHLDELLNGQVRRDEIEHNFELLPQFSVEARADEWDEAMRMIMKL